MKTFKHSLFSVIAIVALSSAVALANPPNLTGKWTVEQTGPNGTTTSVVTLTQTGDTFVGSSDKGTGFNGTFVGDNKINGKWNGPGGAGWLTIYTSPNGHSFNGTWGYNGRASNGTFVGNRVMPPKPITAAGTWIVTGISNQQFAGVMHCTQSGPTVACRSGKGAITINGKYRTKDKVRATWRSPRGVGWFAFWFNDDNQSFNGQWGYGPDEYPNTKTPVGRVVGQRAPSAM